METKNSFFSEIHNKIIEALKNSPAKDLEKNIKIILNQGFSKLDLLTRDEFETQAKVLARTRDKLEKLELRLAELESKIKNE